MKISKPSDIVHKIQLYRLLTKIADSKIINHVFFKGGSCAAMLGYLDRFSVDLDFDIHPQSNMKEVDAVLKDIFTSLQLKVKSKSKNELFYVLQYVSQKLERNTMKLSFVVSPYKTNTYAPFFISEIDRFVPCQTIQTMFGHKLVSLTDRFSKYYTVAGRDMYDIHHFFLKGYRYNSKIIEERTHKTTLQYFILLTKFIKKNVTNQIITEDLNYLLPIKTFQLVKKTLIKETVMFLENEIEGLKR